MKWKSTLQEWEGTISEMVDTLSPILQQTGWEDQSPNIRLIRHYTQLGVLDRPSRRGREAYYQFRHVTQFMTARRLLHDGWPLAKIAEVTATRSTMDLLTLIPDVPSNPAQELIQQFKKSVPSAASAASPITNRQAQLLRQRTQAQQVLPGLGNPNGVVRQRALTQLDLTDWCQVLIDTERLHQIRPEEARTLGELLSVALTESSRGRVRATARKLSRRGNKKHDS